VDDDKTKKKTDEFVDASDSSVCSDCGDGKAAHALAAMMSVPRATVVRVLDSARAAVGAGSCSGDVEADEQTLIDLRRIVGEHEVSLAVLRGRKLVMGGLVRDMGAALERQRACVAELRLVSDAEARESTLELARSREALDTLRSQAATMQREVARAQGVAKDVAARLSRALSAASAGEGRLAECEGRLAESEARARRAEAQLAPRAAAAAALEAELGGLDGACAELRARRAAAAATAGVLEVQALEREGAVAGLRARVERVEAETEGLHARLGRAEGVAAGIQQRLGHAEGAARGLQLRLELAKGAAGGLQAQLDAREAEQRQLALTLADRSDACSKLEAAIDSATKKRDGLAYQAVDIAADIQLLRDKVLLGNRMCAAVSAARVHAE
jgi:chromosome segregation ATPase